MEIESNLKYPRRKKRTIGDVVFDLEEPSAERSKIMQQICSNGTKIERILSDALARENINLISPNYLIEKLDGKPDFVIPKYRIAIFCDGDFWHGYHHDKMRIKSNAGFWKAKIARNMARDNEINNRLDAKGWTVFRFWEHDIIKNTFLCVDKVKQYIERRHKKESRSNRFTFVDLFAGIGGFRIPLEELGGKCLGYSEIDKNCIDTYKRNFIDFKNNDELELGDITKLGQLPFDVDLIVGGVPCQSWSVAGKMQGFDDPRGKLWFDTIRVVKENKPRAFIFENVKGLIDPRNKANLDYLVHRFKKLGYNVSVDILNSYDFGVPQNRERVFIVGIRKKADNLKPFSYPRPLGKKPKLHMFIEGINGDFDIKKKKFKPAHLFGGKIPASRNRFQKNDELNDFFIFCDTRQGHTTIHSWDLIKTSEREKKICLTILRNRRKKIYGDHDGNPLSYDILCKLIPKLKREELEKLKIKKILRYIDRKGYEFVNSKNSSGINGVYRVYMPYSDIFSTLTATGTRDKVALVKIDHESPEQYKHDFIKKIYKKNKFKSISASEAGRLHGFPNWFSIHKDEKTAKSQFGNAVSVPVVFNLAKSLIKTKIFDR